MENTLINIFQIQLDSSKKILAISGEFVWLLLALCVLYTIYWIGKFFFKEKQQEVTVELAFPLVGKISYKLKRNSSTISVAYKIYVELTTRKGVVEFDEKNDSIIDIYKSWYEMFGIIRKEIKSIDGDALVDNEKTKEIVRLATDVLNKGLRPHLTKYHNQYRYWLSCQNNDCAPQELQQKYDYYPEIIKDIAEVNRILVQYSEELGRFVFKK